MDKVVYIAKVEFRRPKMVKTTITKETPKLYALDQQNTVQIIGSTYYTPKRIDKKSEFLFFDPIEAIEYMESRLWEEIEVMRKKINTAYEDAKLLGHLKRELKDE